jgi:hypothetical protein
MPLARLLMLDSRMELAPSRIAEPMCQELSS